MMYNFLSLLIIVMVTNSNSENPCNFYTSVNISHGLTMVNGSTLADGIVYSPDQQFVHDVDGESHLRGCLCLVKTCIRKCCDLGEAYIDGSCNITDDPMVNPFNPPVYDDTDLLTGVTANDSFGFVFQSVCSPADGYVINPLSGDDEKFFLQLNGNIIFPYEMSNYSLSMMQYCIDAWITKPLTYDSPNWTTQYLAFVCYPENESDETVNLIYSLFPIGMIISIPFLIVTFLVYAIIPELRNLHGKSLLGYVSGLIFGYIFLSVVQIQGRYLQSMTNLCISIAFIIYLSFMVSFFWLNVMCFDMWWTFRNMILRGGRRASENCRFLIYSWYAWGTPLILMSMCIVMQFHPDIPDHHIRPEVGRSSCWFHHRRAQMVYYFIPIMIIIISNLVMFIMTTFKIISIKKETAMLRTGDNAIHQFDKNKQRFNLYLKLFLIMGVNWVAEWVSFFVDDDSNLWIFTDFCNSIQGIFIFILFVWQKKVRNLIITRYQMIRNGSMVSRNTISSQFHSNKTQTDSKRSVNTDFIRLSELR